MWYVINAGIIIALLVLTGAVLYVVREFCKHQVLADAKAVLTGSKYFI